MVYKVPKIDGKMMTYVESNSVLLLSVILLRNIQRVIYNEKIFKYLMTKSIEQTCKNLIVVSFDLNFSAKFLNSFLRLSTIYMKILLADSIDPS